MKRTFLLHTFEMTPVLYASLSHFLVLFGYKMFSLYYPLFLEQKGFDLAVIGSMYMLLYASMAFFSIVVWILITRERVSARYAIPIGMAGYAAYSIGMLLAKSTLQFYFWQLELGLSAALFYIGARSIIMEHKSKSYDRDFLYFYSAPFYSNFLAPTVGGLILWMFSFREVFIASLFIYIIAITFALKEWKFVSLDGEKKHRVMHAALLEPLKRDIKAIVFLAAAFIALFSAGVYRSFFVLLLKNEFGLTKSWIVGWVVITSFISIPISWKLAHFVEKRKSESNLVIGNSVSAVMALAVALCFYLPALFLIYLAEYAAKLVSESGKSGLITKLFKHDEESGAVFDTFITAFGVAAGAFVGGLVAELHGIRCAFMMDGVALLSCVLLVVLLSRKVR